MVRPWPLYSAVLWCAVLALPAAAQPQGVHWQHDLEAAKEAARQSGRLVLVHFWTESCGPCVMLDNNVFSQPGVAGAIEAQFVPVKLNANENSATATQFGITRVPTDVIITPEGHVVGKLISPPTPSAYIAEVTQVASQHATRSGGAFADAAASAPMPAQLNAAYAKLPVNPATPPAAPTGLMTSTATGHNTAANAGMPQVGAPFVNTTNQYQTPFATSQSTAPSLQMFGAPPAPVEPATPTAPAPAMQASPAVIGNRYAELSPAAAPAPYHSEPMPPSTAPALTTPAPAPVQTPTIAPWTPAPPTAAQPSGVEPTVPENPAPSTTTITSAADAETSPVPQAAASIPPVQTNVTSKAPTALQSTGPSLPTLPAGAPPLGFEGFCTVSMRTHWKWVQGDTRWGAIHRGRTYLFAGPNEQQKFLENPDYYAPALSGADAVLAVEHRQVVPGRREHSLDYDNQIYLFVSEATLQQFTANPEKYAASVRQAMGIERGRRVR